MKQATGLVKHILKRLPIERKRLEDFREAEKAAFAKLQNQTALVRDLESVATRLGADAKKPLEQKPIEIKQPEEKRRPGRSGKLTSLMSDFVNSHPNGVTPVEVREALDQAGMKYSYTFPYRALENLVKQGRILAKDKKFYPAENKNEPSKKEGSSLF